MFAGYHSIIGSCGKRGNKFLWCHQTSVKLGFCVQSVTLNCSQLGTRRFNSSYSEVEADRSKKTLPWLAKSTGREQREVESSKVSKGFRSSWEESAEKFLKGRTGFREPQKFEGGRNELRNADAFSEDEDRDGDGDVEVVDDPRWDKIRSRVNKFVEVKSGSERPEVRKWINQENWGRKTWKEAKESTVPKLVGEGIYGVGPVLAALSAARREFYALYIQEGLDLSTNNRKKKDKKGFEKVLKMAEKLGLSQKEVSKHNLNMVADNRPHQGLVLDASPLEMVGIKELEPISIEGEKGPLWLALDEVTDPQNLGAIIRSAYFFGASGVVLCAKNSAPLSGVVSKASAGSLELMELRSCKNMMQFLTSSSRNGWRVLGGSVSSKTVPLNEVVPGAPTILVLGSEGMGLRPLVERSCTQLIRIPGNLPIDLTMTGDEDTSSIENPGKELVSFLAVESLNVSVAAGVMLNHLIGSTCDSVGHVKQSETS
ncbi:rRNA methyltransferase 1, mitochondrial-like [Dorcoceras hygrometricum]|uniref:rRNA methyltransferase 1, mitochondrial n=1 Tax=Dorcoceras hygrometricum TaxID=472368 RepID=A0A2Z7AQZ8_9LAMI|nr:rRNA methyltransferase 1, mitochondrial-like [Dorcoceras hygrometricum]